MQSALRAVARENAAKIYLQIPPFGVDDPMAYDAEVVLPAAKGHADRIGVLGGGGSLNPMIMRSVMTGDAGPQVRQKFKERAEELLRLGVSGFGEMAAEHFVGATPYSMLLRTTRSTCCSRTSPANTECPSTSTWKPSRRRCRCLRR